MDSLRSIHQPDSFARLAYLELRSSIIEGKLRPGEVYNEKWLAEQLRISRTPVREALVTLSEQGFVTCLPRRGVRIRRYSIDDIKQIYEFRRAIELAVVEKLCSISKLVDFTSVEAAMAEQQKLSIIDDQDAFLRLDREFHLSMAKLTSNSRFVAALENIRDIVQIAGLEALRLSGRSEMVVQEHRLIFEAVRSGNTQKARKSMEDHLERTQTAVLEQRGNEDSGS